MERIASGGVTTRCQKGSTKVGGLVVKRSDPPLSKTRIKHNEWSGKPEALKISVGFRRYKVRLPTGNSKIRNASLNSSKRRKKGTN
jgi:hypothetical protein